MTIKQVEFAFPLNLTFVAGIYIPPWREVVPLAVIELSLVSPPPWVLVSAEDGS